MVSFSKVSKDGIHRLLGLLTEINGVIDPLLSETEKTASEAVLEKVFHLPDDFSSLPALSWCLSWTH